ncbi:MAG: dockerin type I repeat-containing protein, partial [Monoglobaceae bacterium]
SMFVAQTEIPAKGHSGGTANCAHKAVCDKCGEEYGELDANNHGETEVRNAKAATCTEEGYTGDTYCKGCGEKIAAGSVIAKAAHTIDEVAATPATHALPGNIAYWECSVCGKCFSDENGKNEIAKTDTIIEQIPHEFGEYKHDTAKHWHECECGVTADEGEHTFGEWVIMIEPTEIATGIKERVCTVCGYKETEEIAIVPPTFIYGDLNGDNKVNLLDLIALRKHLAKWSVDIKLTAADCNGDGNVNLLDLILMRKYLAKWDVKFGPQK